MVESDLFKFNSNFIKKGFWGFGDGNSVFRLAAAAVDSAAHGVMWTRCANLDVHILLALPEPAP